VSGGGAIVNIASISALWHGRRSGGAAPAYDAAKAGLLRLTTGLAGLAESDAIRVNALAPGWIAIRRSPAVSSCGGRRTCRD